MARSGGSPALTFGALLAALALLCGAGEVGARQRWSEADMLPVPDMPFLQDDPILLWRMRPDLDVRLPAGPPLRTNHEGLRAPERTPKAGRIRILSLGESTTWGHALAAEDTYGFQLQRRLTSDGLAVEVINAGHPAWSLWQSWRFLETEGAEWEPDVVLVYHLQNDLLLRGASNPRDPFRVPLTDRQLSDARAPFAPLTRLLAHSRLQAALWQYVLAPRLSAALPAAQGDTPRDPVPDRIVALEGMAAWSDAHRARLVLIQPVYAAAHRLSDTLIPTWAAAHSVACVDLPTQKSADGQADFFMPDDTHPTAAGHRWIAATLEASLLRMLRP